MDFSGFVCSVSGRRRLARAVGAEEASDDSRLDGEGEVVDGERFVVGLRQVGDFDHDSIMRPRRLRRIHPRKASHLLPAEYGRGVCRSRSVIGAAGEEQQGGDRHVPIPVASGAIAIASARVALRLRSELLK